MEALCEDKSDIDLFGDSDETFPALFHEPVRVSLQILTACVESISLMEWSYCSARMASLRVCSSLRRLRTALWSDLGVLSSRWFLRALYWRVWILHVSWNWRLICISLVWNQEVKHTRSFVLSGFFAKTKICDSYWFDQDLAAGKIHFQISGCVEIIWKLK